MNRGYYNNRGVAGNMLLARLGVLFGLFFVMLISVSFLIPSITSLNLSPRTIGLLVAVIQNIFIFILPGLFYAKIFSFSPAKGLGIFSGPTFPHFLGVVLAFIIGLPFLNQIVYWNEAVRFPESLKGLEDTLRAFEQQAQEATEILLSTSSFWGMIMGVLIIGCLTGFAEELFFRGGLQKAMQSCNVNHHVAIWVAALLFSAMHFQFFGFIPRLLLGAFFGYLLHWTGSLWPSITAHSINNSLVVITVWMKNNGWYSGNLDKIGISESGVPWVAICSGILLISFLLIGRKWFFRNKEERKY